MLQNKKLIQLLLSGLATFLLWQLYLKAKEENITLGFGMVDVLSAAQDIPQNVRVTPNMLVIKKVPGRFMEPGAIREKVPGQAMKKVVNKITVVAIPAGTTITQVLVQDPSSKVGVAPMITPGKRGYVLRLGNLDVAKLIRPGDRIDILATFTVQDRQSGNQSRATYTILQNILVVAVDKDVMADTRGSAGKEGTSEGRILTLELSPLESEKLAHSHIESGGEISIVVRARGDDAVNPISGTNASNLLNSNPPAPTPTPKPTNKR